ncbi:hypothetical protein [uncultured Clostridium sp.]|uniref:hypothetical protein n=1 Tax=uncultured Clostridium sp. TaxID=59620 RepID=UPI002637D289|nr:hypothetical protein [uncultured Clostridium sp.]
MAKKRNVTVLEEKIEGNERVIKMIVSGSYVTVRRPLVPKEEDIRALYDTCNELFKDHPECFYTLEQTKEKNRLLAENQMIIENKKSLSE